ncbi:MAG: DUF1007 family protein [Thiotrichaceae bacterium]
MSKILKTSLVIFLLLASKALSAGGFHYEIDAHTHFMTNDTGAVSGLEMTWIYDKQISDMIIEDEDLSEAKRADTLKTVASLMIQDLDPMNYFTSLLINDQPATFKGVNQQQLQLVNQKQLKLTFLIPLEKPVNIKNITFDLALADPNGAGIIIYNDIQSLTMDKKLQTRCKPTLVDHKEFEHGQAAQLVKVSCQ